MIYSTKGVCAKEINFDIENDRVKNVIFTGGCDGNHKGLCSLVEGMSVDDVITRLEGINCGMRSSSCPDQLAQALKEYKKSK